MKLYKTKSGIFLETQKGFFPIHRSLDELINDENLVDSLRQLAQKGNPVGDADTVLKHLLPPVENQEVWASGVTYLRSREARMEESKDAGGGDFYDRVYDAQRPEVFFKSTPQRVVGSGQQVRIRRDSKWNVPEPEFTLCINKKGKIVGFTIGNDMSSRDIEGENPLYLPQAKSYDGATALGPCILVAEKPLEPSTTIAIGIRRNGSLQFAGETTLSQMKRTFDELVHYLFLELSFPNGAFLMTGTGVVPPNSFTLLPGDEITIEVAPIGRLVNTVARN